MKINLLQAIVDKIKTITELSSGVFLYSPELDLNTKTKPFVVVRSITDMGKITTFAKAKETDYYVWVYVYPQSNEYKALELPESIRTVLFNELTVTIGEGATAVKYYSLPLDITINRLNGTENDLEKYGSVITCIYKIHD